MSSVSIKVAEQISSLSPKVEDKVVEALVGRELNRRSEALVIVIDLLSRTEADLKKLRADQFTYDEAGNKTAESYSKVRAEERKKLSERIEKYTKSITKALEEGDFENVYTFSKPDKE